MVAKYIVHVHITAGIKAYWFTFSNLQPNFSFNVLKWMCLFAIWQSTCTTKDIFGIILKMVFLMLVTLKGDNNTGSF